MDQDIWMRCPNIGSTGQPVGSGLEYLTELDRLLVLQQRPGCGGCCSRGSKFTVKNRYGEKVYFAKEKISCNCEMAWDVTAFDEYERPSIHMYRPLVCTCQCQPIDVEVCSPPGNLIGSISHDLFWFSAKFKLKNAAGDIMLYIAMPWLINWWNVEFPILGSDAQTVIGKVCKPWTLGITEFQSSSRELDSFGLSFPADLDVSMKAVVLAA
uniref:Phospholipid scramblase n=4 Tax=Lygus hesperus TaxID=30085 RepID=A0A0A9W0W9_LYGHE